MNEAMREPAPGWRILAERSMVTGTLILGCVLFVSMIAAPSVIADPISSGVATAGLILASAVGGWCYAGRTDRSAVIGFGLGMPLGFFYFQNAYARKASIVDLAAGSARIMLVAAIVAIVAGVSAWVVRRFMSPGNGDQR
tara:strand:+ start:4945 stop:5364 length:420 start_codon:yes stop_codon:yes gene_type:complete